MRNKRYYSLLATIVSMAGIAQGAYAIPELEPNHPIGAAQQVDNQHGNPAIEAVLGNLTGVEADDLDFYTFYGQEGDLVTVDIDGGSGGARSVDTVLAIFGSADEGYPMLRLNDDAALDEGSDSAQDARIDAFRLPATGYYVVGVSNYPRYFQDGGTTWNPHLYFNGDYALTISGVSSPMQHINIEIKPGNDELAPINPNARGSIPVALLSSSQFNALSTDVSTLTFGATGEEESLKRCGRNGEDVNGDGLLDLVCHFDNQATNFEPGDLEGIVFGKTVGGQTCTGKGLLKVVPEKRGLLN